MTMLITSSSNQMIKLIRKMRERKTREKTGLFYIEGLRIIGAAVESGADFYLLISCPQLLISEYGQQTVATLRRRGVHQIELSLSVKHGPQGIAAIVKQQWMELEQVRLSGGDVWVALDEVADPGNLGTIMRTLDSIGGIGIILLDRVTDAYDPSVMRASMGSIFNLQLVRCNFEQFQEWKKRFQYPIIGTSGNATDIYYQYSFPYPLIVLMGSERLGLQDHHFTLCDGVVSIPMAGKSDSLNLAMATGIILTEIFNQRCGRPSWNGVERKE
jgi:TrmH family RNA methyltransferase